jgi:hypothetical protein
MRDRSPSTPGAGGPASRSGSPAAPRTPALDPAAPKGSRENPVLIVNRPDGTEPFAYWDEFCRTNAVTGLDVLPNVERLARAKKYTDVRALLTGVLKYRAKDPEPWIYELLAVAIEMDRGRPEDARAALGYAADQAMRTGRVSDLTRVADALAIRKIHDRAGELLDRAAALEPGNARSHWMSLTLAARTLDPNRAADAAERLLSLGWPGTDDAWRAEVRKQVEAIAKTLRENNRAPEAARLLERLKTSEQRDLVLVLTWDGEADLDLTVEEPLGAIARLESPRTVFGGALLQNGYGKNAEERYACPRGFDGTYTARVTTIASGEANPARTATLTIVAHEGTDRETKKVVTIDPTHPEPVEYKLAGGRRTTVLPYQAGPPELAAPDATAPAATPTSPTTPALTPERAAEGLAAPEPPK